MLKSLFVTVTQESSLGRELSMTALRVYVGLAMAFGHGWGKVPPGDGFVEGVTGLGFPMPYVFAWAAAFSEFAGGLLLAIGLFTRPAATLVACTMFVAGVVFHAADPFNRKELAFLYLVIALVFMFRGAGRFSVDRFIR